MLSKLSLFALAVLAACGSTPQAVETTQPRVRSDASIMADAAPIWRHVVELNEATKKQDAIDAWNAEVYRQEAAKQEAARIEAERVEAERQSAARQAEVRRRTSTPQAAPRVASQAPVASGSHCGGDLPPCYIVQRESGGDPRAQNPTSSASGLFQITDGTWGGYGGYKHAKDAPVSVQEERAAQVWDHGRGCGNWTC